LPGVLWFCLAFTILALWLLTRLAVMPEILILTTLVRKELDACR